MDYSEVVAVQWIAVVGLQWITVKWSPFSGLQLCGRHAVDCSDVVAL